MNRIMIFSGTTEGRDLAQHLAGAGVQCLVSVATEYGQTMMGEHDLIDVRVGRMTSEEMEQLWHRESFLAVIDATHPYATQVTENIKQSLSNVNIPYIRLEREKTKIIDEKVLFFKDCAECASFLERTSGEVLLTTGSKELDVFCQNDELRKRLIVRVLPAQESLEICRKNQLEGRQIVAMQGPFTVGMNLEMIRQFGISYIVTKESGKTGGEDTKLAAAKQAGIMTCVITRPEVQKDLESYDPISIWKKLAELTGRDIECAKGSLQITLAGVGMGDADGMTCAVRSCIEQTDYLFGAKRLIQGMHAKRAEYPYYLKEDILPILSGILARGENAAATVLFSGDAGFFSGCKKLADALKELEHTSVRILPGISTVSALGAAAGIDWQDAMIVSAHGVRSDEWEAHILHGLRHRRKIFFLTGGAKDVNRIGELMEWAGAAYTAVIGRSLSYPEEQILKITAKDCREIEGQGLYAGFLLPDEDAKGRAVTPGIRDEKFIRAEVPMTKEEVRAVSICKLGLTEDAVAVDIGSGTGSVAVEMAMLSPKIHVYAIEDKPAAQDLICKNCEKFGVRNVKLLEKTAPDGLADIEERITHAFIGGSGGHMEKIIETLYQINPNMRVTANAATLETQEQLRQVTEKYPVSDLQIMTISVNPVKKVGRYHMLQANHPVMIFAFTFTKKNTIYNMLDN